MRMISGAILLLAASVLFAAMWIRPDSGHQAVCYSMFGEGAIGAALLLWGIFTDCRK
jgi:hypothetical protein